MGNGRKSILSHKDDVLKCFVLNLSVAMGVLIVHIIISDNTSYH